MQKQRKVGFYLDYFHKGFVCSCIAATLYGCSYIMYRGFIYFTDVRPQLQQLKDAENRKLLVEGASEEFNDIAPAMKM